MARFDGGVIGSKGQGIKQMVGEVVLSSNDVTRRSEKVKLGRVFLLLKMFSGFQERDNMLEALMDLTELNQALTDKSQPLDYLASTTSFWFKNMDIPSNLSSQLAGRRTSQMMIWFAKTCQNVHDLTASSLREIFTVAALNMWPYLYDEALP